MNIHRETEKNTLQGIDKRHLPNLLRQRELEAARLLTFGRSGFSNVKAPPVAQSKKLMKEPALYEVDDVSIAHPQLQSCLAVLSQKEIVFSSDKGLAMISLMSGVQKPFSDELDKIYSLDAKGNFTVSVNSMSTVYLFDNLTRKPLFKLYDFTGREEEIPHFGGVRLIGGNLVVSPKEVWLCGNNKEIWMHDLNKPEVRNELKVNIEVNYFSENADSNLIIAAVDGNDVPIFDRRTLSQVMTLKGHTDFSMGVDLHQSLPLAATGNQDNSAKVWDLRNHKEAIATMPTKLSAANKVLFVSDSKIAVMETMDFVSCFEFRSCIQDSKMVIGFSTGICLSPGGFLLYWGVTCPQLVSGIVRVELEGIGKRNDRMILP